MKLHVQQVRLFTVLALAGVLAACGPSRRVVLPNGEVLPWDVRSFQTSALDTEQAVATTSARDDRPYQFAARGDGQVAPGYEVQLASGSDEKLNGRYRIDASGKLELPYGVRLDTAGLDEKGLKKRILSSYANFFQAEPNVGINIVEKKYWVDVRGLVKKPGQYLMREDSSLDEVLAAAGGLADGGGGSADEAAQGPLPRYVRIQQGNSSGTIKLAEYYAGNIQISPRWRGGDVVFAQTRMGNPERDAILDPRYVYVVGQVKQPGELRFRTQADTIDYLIQAGGPTDRADLDTIEIIRTVGDEKKSILFSLQEVEERDKLPQVQGGDTIIVHANNPTQTERRTALGAQVAAVVTSVAAILIAAASL